MNEGKLFARIENAVPLRSELRFSQPVSWAVASGENWAVTGPNGAGKSLLADILTRRVALRSGEVSVDDPQGTSAIRSIAFKDIYSLADCRNMYYQQRWNSSEVDAAPLAGELFPEFSESAYDRTKDIFGIKHLLGRRMISLSSGELRKLLVARVLSFGPRLLILDNPFIGLDAASRVLLSDMLRDMSQKGMLQCIFVVSDPADIPDWTDRVLPVKSQHLYPPLSREEFLGNRSLLSELFDDPIPNPLEFPSCGENLPLFAHAIRMNGVKIAYGGRKILDGIDWVVHSGEKWALVGANGSGKSTLLSLVCGDNPQAYANDITLFDRRRGTGESIWEIKKRIGYVSPEMHAFYLERIPCAEVVASGFFDSVGLYRKCTPAQREAAVQWMRIFGAGYLSERFFTDISYGQQRLILLVRAFVKDPDLLILDEPFHGLDAGKKKRAGAVVEAFSRRANKTLIFVSHYREEIPLCVDREMTLKKPAQ